MRSLRRILIDIDNVRDPKELAALLIEHGVARYDRGFDPLEEDGRKQQSGDYDFPVQQLTYAESQMYPPDRNGMAGRCEHLRLASASDTDHLDCLICNPLYTNRKQGVN